MNELEQKYSMFHLTDELKGHLVRLSSKRYPFTEKSQIVRVETHIKKNGEETSYSEEVLDAKLV